MTSPVTEGPSWGPRHPVLIEWFRRRYGEPTRMQRRAWETILKGENTLVSSPTGSGKTLAALMPCIERIVANTTSANADGGQTRPGVRILYVTPLKALNNDVLEHLEEYENEMSALAESLNVEWPGFRVAVRTGDTTASKRSAMLKRPPDILITTPESLFILLTSVRGQEMLSHVESLIVDEVHHLADSPRGTHFSLSVERLARIVGKPFVRIGLSATQKPISRVANFLGGWHRDGHLRPVSIIEANPVVALDIRVSSPVLNLGVKGREESVWNPLVELISTHINEHRTTIIFVNNRRLCERLVYRINEHVGFELSRAHHGSISRDERLLTERLFKQGELRCIVATSSLELGIDIGHVDLVMQVDSPKRVNSLLQRVGRAEHTMEGVSKGVFVLKNLNEVYELCALIHLANAGEKDEIHIVKDRMDILCQHAVSMAAVCDFAAEDLLELARQTECYHRTELEDVQACLDIVAGKYPFLRKLVLRHSPGNIVTRLPGTAMAALMGSGTIISTGLYPVVVADSKIRVGDLDEEFVHESRVGDVFRLGANSWRIKSISHQSVTVTPSSRLAGSVPFWRGEEYGRSFDVGVALGQVLSRLDELFETSSPSHDDVAVDGDPSNLPGAILSLMNQYHLDERAATYAAKTAVAQRKVAAVPTDRRIVVETFRDETRALHVIIHSVFGLRFNRTWMMGLVEALNGEDGTSAVVSITPVYSRAKDDGIHFVFSSAVSSIQDVVWQVTTENLLSLLMRTLPSTPQFSLAFRRQAETALLLTRGWTRTPTWKRRMQSDELLMQVAALEEPFLLYRSAQKECLETDFDVRHVLSTLADMGVGRVEVITRETMIPSPMARPFLSDWNETKLYQQEGVSPEVLRLLAAFDDSYITDWLADDANETNSFASGNRRENPQESHDGASDGEDEGKVFSRHPDVWLSHLVDLHHLGPNARLEGMDGLRQVVAVLQGIFLPASHWESIVFPARIVGYRKEDLDLLCSTGEVRWLGRKDEGQKEGKVAFFTFGNGSEHNALYDMNLPVSGPSQHPETLRVLVNKGASFMASLFVDPQTTGEQMVDILFDLVWEGRVANDQFAPIRHRLNGLSRRNPSVRSAVGRWYATTNPDTVVLGQREVASERDRLAYFVRQRISQYGLICRATFADAPVDYDVGREVLYRLEDVGLVTRGLFVSGISSVQFANRRFVARLLSDPPNTPPTVVISAVDPANPFGLLLPWPVVTGITFARKPGNYLVMREGRMWMWIEGAGKRLAMMGSDVVDSRVTGEDMSEAILKDVLQALVRIYSMRKIRIDSFNGDPVQASPIAQWLENLGAERNGKSYVLWSLNLRR